MPFTAVRRKGVISHFAVLMGFAGIIARYVALWFHCIEGLFEQLFHLQWSCIFKTRFPSLSSFFFRRCKSILYAEI